MTTDLETARRFFAASPFMVELGVEPIALGNGTVTTQMAIRPCHLQHTGQVHAGVLATIADHTMGAAGQTLAPEGFWIITAELKTSLLRAATGRRLVCEARVIKPGQAITFTEADVFAVGGGAQADGGRRLVMKASATMALVAASRMGRP